MVNYLDSRRIMGTTAERSSIPIPATAGGWVELGRTTLGSAGDNIDVSGLADKRYLMTLVDATHSSSIASSWRLNSDSGTNYSWRSSINGGADGTGTSDTEAQIGVWGNLFYRTFNVGYLANYSTKEKLGINHEVAQNATGATNEPRRIEHTFKWANTSNPISSINYYNLDTSGGNWATGSEVVVLGWDPSDTHTTNFWEELADVNASASSTSINTGTFTAKKYLWIQAYVNATGADMSVIGATVNSDVGSNYANRFSDNGGADSTITSNQNLVILDGGSLAQNVGGFINMFVINNSANEKLFTGVGMKSNTAGAGNAPSRREVAQKWTNTSSQITSFQINRVAGTGTFDTTSFIKVWGSD